MTMILVHATVHSIPMFEFASQCNIKETFRRRNNVLPKTCRHLTHKSNIKQGSAEKPDTNMIRYGDMYIVKMRQFKWYRDTSRSSALTNAIIRGRMRRKGGEDGKGRQTQPLRVDREDICRYRQAYLFIFMYKTYVYRVVHNQIIIILFYSVTLY